MSKIKQLEEKHQIEKHQVLTDEYKQKQRDNALLILGGVRVADKIATSISSQIMQALIMFQNEQMYLSFGNENFVDFLENNEYSPMTKNQFYKRKDIFVAEGEKMFDLMNEIGVSLATRKLLAAGNYEAITIEGDTLTIGSETADLSNTRLVRTLIESYADDFKRLKDENTKKQEKLEKAEQTILDGSKQVEQLRRQLDTNNEGSALDRAQSRLINAFIKFNDELGETPLIDRIDRDSVLDTLWMLLEESRKRFGSNKNFTVQTTNQPEVDPLIAQALEDGFDD